MSATSHPTDAPHTLPDRQRGLLLVGHGTRDARGQAEFSEVARLLAARVPQRPFAAAFLELARPTIADGIASLIAAGVQHLDVMPLLLFSAGHAQRDIPQAVAAAIASRLAAMPAQTQVGDSSRISIRQTPPLECSPALLELSGQKMESALSGVKPLPAEETALVMVGRGSLDAQANAEMARFARLRFESSPAAWLETCFLAMTGPRLEPTLEQVAKLGYRRVIVQPHLLFSGELADRVQSVVQVAARQFPSQEWIATGHLGPDVRLVDALLERLAILELE